MNIIAVFVRDSDNGNLEGFEDEFGRCVGGELTVNKILAVIREVRTCLILLQHYIILIIIGSFFWKKKTRGPMPIVTKLHTHTNMAI
jgi:hypothetical protein